MEKANLTKNDFIGQTDFINNNTNALAALWEANKEKKGYVQVFIKPDYLGFYGLKFIEQKRVRKDLFMKLENEAGNYMLIRFLWEKTHTYYRAAIGYKKIVVIGNCAN